MALWSENYLAKLCWTSSERSHHNISKGMSCWFSLFSRDQHGRWKNYFQTGDGIWKCLRVWCTDAKNERVQSYATRMEGSLNQIWVKFLGTISDSEAEIKLMDRLFYRMMKTLRDSIWYLYDNLTITYMQLLVASRKTEAEVVEGKIGTVTIKAKAATTNDELVSLKQQVSDLVAVVKANHVWDSIKKNTWQNDQRNDNKDKRAWMFGTNRHLSSTGSSKNNQSMQPLGA